MYEELIDDYIAYLEIQGKSKNTIKTYTGAIKRFLEFLGDKDVFSINKQDLMRFLIYLKRRRNLDNNSIRLYVRALSSFLKFLGFEELSKEIKAPKVDKRLPKFLSFEEVMKLVEAVEKDRDKLIIKTLFYTGMRVSELTNLKVSDIIFDEQIIKIKGKGGKERIVPVPRHLLEELKIWVSNKNPSDRVFNITSRHVERIIQRARERAGIEKKVTPHVLRHSLATHLLQKGIDIRYIQELLGHSSLSVTQVYTHVMPTHLKEIYRKVFE